MKVEEKHLLEALMLGESAVWFWFFWVGGVVVPAILIIVRRGALLPRIVTAAVLVNIGMWLKRFVITIPSIQVPLIPYEFGSYTPTWVEWSITAAAFAAFMLIFAIFAKLLPVLSIWEVAEEAEIEAEEEARRTL